MHAGKGCISYYRDYAPAVTWHPEGRARTLGPASLLPGDTELELSLEQLKEFPGLRREGGCSRECVWELRA